MMLTITAAALSSLVIVTQDQSALRGAPREAGAQQATLWQGDVLEVRGTRLDYLQVYDHRRERAGYVRATQVRAVATTPEQAPELLSVVRFVREMPGAEALGIAYAAAYLKAVPAQQLTAEPFDAIGVMADRLARRASARQSKAGEAQLAAHLEVVAGYGVKLRSFERSLDPTGAIQVCYDGEAFRRVLAMKNGVDAEQQARAALGVSRPDCNDPQLRPSELEAEQRWQLEQLDRLGDTVAIALSEQTKNRLRMRRAGLHAALAFARARRGEATQGTAEAALQQLAAINKMELGDDDLGDYNDAAMRVAASRWAAEPVPAPNPAARLAVRIEAGEPGQQCAVLVSAGSAAGSAKALARRCSYGAIWAASAKVNTAGTALALAVQPLPSWRELWVFKKTADGWTVEVLPPGGNEPLLGYVEFAGWVPDGERLLVARELRSEGRWKRTFEVVMLETLNTEKLASTPQLLAAFQRWQAPDWKRQTVALR